MWLIEVHWTQTASCHVLIGLARYSTASEGFCLISREIIYSTSNLLPVVKCHCTFTRPVFFMVQLWPSPRTSSGARKPRLSFPVFRLLGTQFLALPVQPLRLPWAHPWPAQSLSGATTLASAPWKALEAFPGCWLLLGKRLCRSPEPVPCPGLQLPHCSVSFGPLSAQLLIINNTVYLYQNHYLNWLHDTCCSPNCTPGKMCYKICDFVLCNYPSMGYKALLWCLK